MNSSLIRIVALSLLLVGGAYAQGNPKMSSSEALLRDLDTAKSMGGMGKLLIAQDGKSRSWPEYCGASQAESSQGKFREAVQQAARALAMGEKFGDVEATFFAARDMAYAYYLAGDTINALEWMERTDAAYKIVSSRFRDASQSYFPMLTKSKILHMAGRYQEALDASLRLQEVLPYFGAGELVGSAKLAEAAANISLGKGANSLKSLEEISKSSNALNKSAALAELAKISTEKGDLPAAKDYATQAVAASPKDSPLVQAGLIKGLAAVQTKMGDKDGAVASLTQAIDMVARARGKFSSAAVRTGLLTSNQQLFDDAIDLAMEMGLYDKALMWSEASRSQLILDQLRERQLVKLPDFSSSSDLLAQSRRVQFLSFHVSAKNTHVWLVEGGKLRANTLNTGKADLAKLVEAFRSQIIAGGTTSHALARKLYETLILPLDPADGLTMVIIPSGPLHLLPFHALRNTQGWFASRTPIRYEVSLATAVAPESGYGAGSLFAVGNPTLDKPEHSLPGAEAEVNAIKPFFTDAVLALKTRATRAKFLMESGKAGFVHAAAHVTLDELDPMSSALKLSPNGKESGDFLASDFLKLDLKNVNLVTLSACNSGVGRIAPGDEFYGFKRSILLSGAKSLALTYWSVDDDSTAELMTQFYKHMREGKMPAHLALQKAQMDLIKGGKYADPYHWASFMLVGTFNN